MVREFRIVCWTDQHLFFPSTVRSFLINPSPAGPRSSKGHSAAIRGPYRREIRREIKSKAGAHDANQVKQPDDLAGTQRLRVDSRGGHSRSIRRQREIVVRKCSGFPASPSSLPWRSYQLSPESAVALFPARNAMTPFADAEKPAESRKVPTCSATGVGSPTSSSRRSSNI